MPDSIKAIRAISEAATAREHATTHMVWPLKDRAAQRHAPPERKINGRKVDEAHHEGTEPLDPAIHHIDILA